MVCLASITIIMELSNIDLFDKQIKYSFIKYGNQFVIFDKTNADIFLFNKNDDIIIKINYPNGIIRSFSPQRYTGYIGNKKEKRLNAFERYMKSQKSK